MVASTSPVCADGKNSNTADEIASVAGGEGQGGGRREQLGAALDLGGPGAGEIALCLQQVEDGRHPFRTIRVERGRVCFLGRLEQGHRVLVLAEGRLYVRVV